VCECVGRGLCGPYHHLCCRIPALETALGDLATAGEAPVAAIDEALKRFGGPLDVTSGALAKNRAAIDEVWSVNGNPLAAVAGVG
jgi:hypothetical protein